MTIQAYQTLYESSIAYGMRKALQAEQSKASTLIEIQQVEEECNDLEDEVEGLKKQINRMLHDADKERKLTKENHETAIMLQRRENDKQLGEVKGILTTFDEPDKKDGDSDWTWQITKDMSFVNWEGEM